MTHHPIHLHGHEFMVTGTEGGAVPKSARWPEVTTDVAVGQMRQLEFIAEAEGDWVLHCHKSHHTMNAMGRDVPTMIGVDHRGMADMADMADMGGMFSMLKVRRDQKRGDYQDPGWCRHPRGTVAFEWTGAMPEPAGAPSPGGQAMTAMTMPTNEAKMQFRKPSGHSGL